MKSDGIVAQLSPMPRFLAYDWRVRPLAAYAFIVALTFNAAPACVLPMFAVSSSDVSRLLLAGGVGNFVGGFAFGRISMLCGRRLCMVLASACQECAFALLAFAWYFDNSKALALTASAVIGVGNSLQFANLSACIASAMHDLARESFSSKELFVSIFTIAFFLVVPQLNRGLALGLSSGGVFLATGYLCTAHAFFRTLPVSAGSLEFDKISDLGSTCAACTDDVGKGVTDSEGQDVRLAASSFSAKQEREHHPSIAMIASEAASNGCAAEAAAAASKGAVKPQQADAGHIQRLSLAFCRPCGAHMAATVA
jgi:MFS family permease